jgi:hypothetical protein
VVELLAVPARLELATFGLGNRCSIRLSYGTNFKRCHRLSGSAAGITIRLAALYSIWRRGKTSGS